MDRSTQNMLGDLLKSPDSTVEVVAYCLIQYVKSNPQNQSCPTIDKRTIGSRQWLETVIRQKRIEESGRKLMEALAWLERNGLIIEEPIGLSQRTGVFRLSDFANDLKTQQDVSTLQRRLACRKEILHERIIEKCWSAFLSGEFSTSIFAAFKEVEVAVREVGGFSNSDIGDQLMQKAFLNGGKLVDTNEVSGEQAALAYLFRGAVGRFRNPTAHRHVEIDSPEETYEMLAFASHLMRIVLERGALQKSSKS